MVANCCCAFESCSTKVAVVAVVAHARRGGLTVLDVQVPSAHLTSLGARTLPRREYLARVADAVRRPVRMTA
jgi:leucyl/phenylalanyl-tRNA--protein transferase